MPWGKLLLFWRCSESSIRKIGKKRQGKIVHATGGDQTMRSYALAITASMLLSAIYVFQNVGDVTVRFFIFEHVFPQGVWEALLFSAGAVLMWFFSIFASLELRVKYRSQLKDRDKKIKVLEEEKTSLLAAIGRVGAQGEHDIAGKAYVGLAEEPLPPVKESADSGETGRMSG